jgi:hypothetical protein
MVSGSPCGLAPRLLRIGPGVGQPEDVSALGGERPSRTGCTWLPVGRIHRLIALAMVGSACGSPVEGIAGPPPT